MKIFKVKKYINYKGDKNIINLQTKTKNQISYVNICNPVNSSKIYIIDNIDIKDINVNNELFLYAKEVNKDIDKKENSLLLDKLLINKSNKVSVLQGEQFILLPGGELYIELSQYDKSLSINVSLIEEEI